jgi:peroxiredoxin
MAETPSTMLPLGTKAPEFKLYDTISETTLTLSELVGKNATVIIFICNHCPYVIHIRSKLAEVAKVYQQQDISFIAISSNDAEKYPGDSPEKMRIEAQAHGFTFPYLYDESQAVAQAYQAACTPDFYVFDSDLHCVYRGCFDGATPGNGVAVTGGDLCAALDNVLEGKPVNPIQKPSLGCNIKWKKKG